jgi:hypothetical protein
MVPLTRVSAAVFVVLALVAPAPAQTVADPEKFKRAIEEYVARTSVNLSRPCVNLWKIPPTKQAAFPDTRFDWSPGSFVIILDGETDPQGYLTRTFGLAARHGYFERRAAAHGALEYRMTWTGYAGTNGQGCFYTGSAEAVATVKSYERRGAVNWQVVATGQPRSLLPWAADPEFRQLFTAYSDHSSVYGTGYYEVTPSGFGFSVVDQRPPPETLGIPRPLLLLLARRGPRPERVAKEAGVLTRERVRAALNDYATQAWVATNRVCIWLPHMVDETNLSGTSEGQAAAPLHFTIYNLAWRPGGADGASRNYDVLTRLESVGVVRSERIAASEYRGGKANGAIRFTLTDAGRAMTTSEQPSCLLVGHVETVEVLDFQQFTPLNTRPAFVARTKFKPLAGREAVIARFRHLERLTEQGGAMIGNIHFIGGKLSVEGSYHNPEFEADRSQLPPLPFENAAR